MNKNVFLKQKEELNKLLSKPYVSREQLTIGQKFLASNLIKVVTGPRRAGKSIFCLELLQGKQFAYVNFDDEAFKTVKNYNEITDGLEQFYPKSSHYLFDEIQNLPDWEIFVNKLQRRGFNLILTGSNSKLLSGELATELTGRHLALEIFPFSYREFKKINKGTLYDYLQNGGFPEVTALPNDPKVYLPTLFDSIVLTDVVKRYNINLPVNLTNLSTYLLANIATTQSYSKLKNALNFRSVFTLQRYVSYLNEAYLFYELLRFSPKLKEQFKAPRKIYSIDNGIVTARSFTTSANLGKLCENLVFLQLLRRGYKPNQSLFYYQTKNGKEVDFVLREDFKIKKLIQVCYDISDPQTKKREESALLEAEKELNCDNSQLITFDSLESWLLAEKA